jgi:hypothetical protein
MARTIESGEERRGAAMRRARYVVAKNSKKIATKAVWQCWRYSSFGIDRRPSRRRRCRGEDQDVARRGLTEFTGAFRVLAGFWGGPRRKAHG